MATPHHFRTTERRPVSFAATIEGLDGRGTIEARITDIGLGGARIEFALERTPIPGTTLTLHAVLPNLWLPLALDSSIVWSTSQAQRGKAGVRFKNPSPAVLRAVLEAIAPTA